jgi:hypothetical protein
MSGVFIPLIAASAAVVGAIIYGFSKRASSRNIKNDGGNFKSDGQAQDTGDFRN